MFVEISYKVKYKSGQGHCIIWSDGDNDIVSSEANICSCRHSWHVTLRHASWHLSCEAPHHKSAAPEGGEVARNQAPPHRLDWPINAMFILGIQKSKIKQSGYDKWQMIHFNKANAKKILWNINQYVQIHKSRHNHFKILQFLMLNKYILQWMIDKITIMKHVSTFCCC